MSRIAPRRVQRVQLPALAVARPVTGTWGQTIADQLAFLHGSVKHVVASCRSPSVSVGTINVTYVRSPGARVLLVCLAFHATTDPTSLITCNVTISGASTLSGTTTTLDGATNLPVPINNTTTITRAPTLYEKYFDVSALTIGSPIDVVIATTTASGAASGVESINMYEVPRDVLDGENNPSTDEGISAAWPFQGNQLYAGSASTTSDAATGFERVVQQLDRARAYFRPDAVNLKTVEDTTKCWTHATAADTFTAFLFNKTEQPRWYFIVRRLYSTSTRANYEIRVRYNVNGFAPTFRTITPDGTTNDVTLTNTGGAWGVVTGAVTIETNTTDQEVYVAFEIRPNTASSVTTYISHVALYCKET